MNKEQKLLTEARALVAKGLTKWPENAVKQLVGWDDPRAVYFDAFSALIRVSVKPESWVGNPTLYTLKKIMEGVNGMDAELICWQNAEGRTLDEVLAAFDAAIEAAGKEKWPWRCGCGPLCQSFDNGYPEGGAIIPLIEAFYSAEVAAKILAPAPCGCESKSECGQWQRTGEKCMIAWEDACISIFRLLADGNVEEITDIFSSVPGQKVVVAMEALDNCPTTYLDAKGEWTGIEAAAADFSPHMRVLAREEDDDSMKCPECGEVGCPHCGHCECLCARARARLGRK